MELDDSACFSLSVIFNFPALQLISYLQIFYFNLDIRLFREICLQKYNEV